MGDATADRVATQKSVQTQAADPLRTANSRAPQAAGFLLSSTARLQRAIGNRALSSMLRNSVIQRKLSVSQPDDAHEREADRIADQVMRSTALQSPVASGIQGIQIATSPALQRSCGCGCNGAGDCAERKEATSEASDDETESLQVVDQVLRSTGQSLDHQTRSFMDSRFGYDFAGVRVHTGERADRSARAVNALAYTVGNNVVFSAGRYDPQSTAGRRLLAHELTHVVQQQSGATSNQIARAAIHDGRILDEGSCADLVKGSRFICCDPTNGIKRAGKKKDIDGKDCPDEKFTPIFTCDSKCDKALTKGCSDSDNWMALPGNRFARRKCNQDLVICANNSFTHAYVRDKSETKNAWEVSKAIPAALGVSPDFRGVVYPDETDADFLKDARCRPAPTPAPKGGGGGGGSGGSGESEEE